MSLVVIVNIIMVIKFVFGSKFLLKGFTAKYIHSSSCFFLMPLWVRICGEGLSTRSSFVTSLHSYGIDVCKNWLWSLYLFPQLTYDPACLCLLNFSFHAFRACSPTIELRNRTYIRILDGSWTCLKCKLYLT